MAQKQASTPLQSELELKYNRVLLMLNHHRIEDKDYVLFYRYASRLFYRLNKHLSLKNSYYSYIFSEYCKYAFKKLAPKIEKIDAAEAEQFAFISDDALEAKYRLSDTGLLKFKEFFKFFYNAVIHIYCSTELRRNEQQYFPPHEGYPSFKTMTELTEEDSFDLLAACQVLRLSDKDAENEYDKIVTAKVIAKITEAELHHDSSQSDEEQEQEQEQEQPDIHMTKQIVKSAVVPAAFVACSQSQAGSGLQHSRNESDDHSTDTGTGTGKK